MYHAIKRACDGDYEYKPPNSSDIALKGDLISLVYINGQMPINLNNKDKIYPVLSKIDIFKVKDKKEIYAYLISFNNKGEQTLPSFPIIKLHNGEIYNALDKFFEALITSSKSNLILDDEVEIKKYPNDGIYHLVGLSKEDNGNVLHRLSPLNYNIAALLFHQLDACARYNYDEVIKKYEGSVNERAILNLGRQYKLNGVRRVDK